MFSNSFLQDSGSSTVLLLFGGCELTYEGLTGNHGGVTGKS